MSFVVNIVNKVTGAVTDVVTGGVDLVGDAIGVVGDAIDWVVEEIVAPVVSGVGDIIEAVAADPLTAIATVAATVVSGGAYLWTVPLINGASTLAKGGDIGDALKSAAISFVGGKVGDIVGTAVNPTIAETIAGAGLSEGATSAVTTLVQTGIAGGAEAAATAIVYGQNPLDAFATGGINAAVGATVGQIAEAIDVKFGDTIDGVGATVDGVVAEVTTTIDNATGALIENSGWENLQDALKDTVVAGITAELTGGELSTTQIGNIVSKYTGVTEFVSDFISENTDISDKSVAVLTSAVTNAASTAIAGGSTADAFFGTLNTAGAAELTAIINKPVDAFIDKVSGAAAATEIAAAALREAEANATTAANNVNSTCDNLLGCINEQDR